MGEGREATIQEVFVSRSYLATARMHVPDPARASVGLRVHLRQACKRLQAFGYRAALAKIKASEARAK